MTNQKIETITKNGITLMKRDNSFILQKSFKNVGQKQIRFRNNKRDAFTKAARFLQTADLDGYDKAMAELAGKKILKRGDDPTLEQIAELYRAFCIQSPNPPRPPTIDHNIARLKCLMKRVGVSTVGRINQETIFNKQWYKGVTPTPVEKRTFTSAVRAARSVFKKSARRFYESNGLSIQDPFEGMELVAPKISQFIPPSAGVIESILDTFEYELQPHYAMIVLLAFCGLRRSEIEAIVPANFSQQSDRVILSIEETGEFQPKAGQSGHVHITSDMYQRLIRLRGNVDCEFFVPSASKKKGKGRLWDRVKVVNDWLMKKGLKNKPLHSCRKIIGSIVAQKDGIPAAASILRNTQAVCMENYAGSMSSSCVDVFKFVNSNDPFQALANELGMTVEEVKRKLSA